MPKELKQILLESRDTSSHCFDLSDCFTRICRIKKYNLESETSHALPAVSLCKNSLSNALQKDGQLKHHPLKVHEVVPLSLLLWVNRNTACVPGQYQRDAKTAVNIYLCYNWNQDACDRSHELKRTPVQMSPCELATFLWWLYSHRTGTDTFNCPFLEDMNCFLELSICFCDDCKACQMETFPRVTWMPPPRQQIVSHNGH